jgi:polysaccharide chain length determinant protein (PEP-CTERM system associated)
VAVATTAIAVTYRLPNFYRSQALILIVPQRVPETYVRSTVTTRIEDQLNSISQQILSRTQLERIVQDFNLYADRRRTEIMEDIVDRMRADIRVDVVKGDAFTVSFTAGDPRTAMRVTERLASLFIDESLKDRELLAEGTNQFLESQLADARRQLIDNEKKLEDYRRRHDGELPTQLDANVSGMHNTQMQLQSLRDSINRDRDRRLVLERAIADASLETSSASTPSPVPRAGAREEPAAGATAEDRLREAEAILQAMQLRLTPEHPDVIRMKRTIADLEKKAIAEAASRPVSDSPRPVDPTEAMRHNRLNESKAELENLDHQIAVKLADEKKLQDVQAMYQKRIEATPTREAELTELMRDYDTLTQSYRSLLSKKEDSQITANLERRQIGEQFKLVDPARLPERPFSPNRQRLYLIELVAALAAGFGLAALLEYLDRGLRSEEDVKLALNLMVLATIPVLEDARQSNRRRHLVALSLAVGAAMVAGVAVVAWRLLN